MRKFVAIPMGVLGVIALVFMCLTCTMAALFLQTMNVLTGRIVVAEVVMYPIQTDNNGDYIEVDFTPYQYQSALLASVNRDEGTPQLGTTQRFRLYGDVVAVRGPLITLRGLVQVLGFQNIYKLALIEGQYRSQGAINRLEGSRAVLNGGFEAAWWDINNQEGQYPYNLFIERVTISGDEEFGFRGQGTKRYHIVVTNQSITWDLIEDNR